MPKCGPGTLVIAALLLGNVLAVANDKTAATPVRPEVSVDAASSEIVIVRGDKRFLVDLNAGSVREIREEASTTAAASSSKETRTQEPTQAQQQQPADTKPTYYVAGDVRLMTLPTHLTLPKGGLRVDFTHRFPYGAAFSGKAQGHELIGLDSFAVPSFGFSYGVTNRIELSIYRSPSVIGRPIEMRAAFKLLSEKDDQPLNLTARFSVDGQNDFGRNFTTNFELIVSKSLGTRGQVYAVPTVSIHNRPLLQVSGPLTAPPFEQPCAHALATGVPASMNVKPCADTFSIGFGLAIDVRPTIALFAEVQPTVVNGTDLGIHRPPYSFGIQKKIWRHAFTFGFTTAPGTTVAQRISTRANLFLDPKADKPSGLFIGFNLSRQVR